MLQRTALNEKKKAGIGIHAWSPSKLTTKIVDVDQPLPEAGRYRLRGNKISTKKIDVIAAGQMRASLARIN
tara:strand:+ start:510 stop:722 length:213 start_codon:yes stop_codon:yes gene_type:complete